MGFKGSIVVKRTRLLDLYDDLNYYWRSKIDDNARWNVFGQKITLDRIVEGEYCEPGIRAYAEHNWYDPCQHFGKFYDSLERSVKNV